MFWTVVLAILLVCVAAFGLPQATWNVYRKWKVMRELPGWPTHWFWGNLHQLKLDEASITNIWIPSCGRAMKSLIDNAHIKIFN